MRKLSVLVAFVLLLSSCGVTKNVITADKATIKVDIDLINVTDDKVLVSVNPGSFTEEEVVFYIPKTVPGTYSNNDYGKYIESFKAFDYKGQLLPVVKKDNNTWVISNGKNLDKVSYLVNDTYDSEKEVKEDVVFSPAGTNIKKGDNFMLNLHGFVGYFKNLKEVGYELAIKHPANLKATTSLNELVSVTEQNELDTFVANRYFEVIDNPILYAKSDISSFEVNGITVNLSVYSPNGVFTSASLKDKMLKMMTAQKSFLGDIDSTKEYNILLYLSKGEADAGGFGALEHHTSTVVVLPEQMDMARLEQAMVDVVSHEFFHIVTPLSVHSEEIQFFDFNAPKMSKHLWMYEGTTEYFANLFQIQQGLIDDAEFYQRIMGKINNAKSYDDTMSFTVMSRNILDDPYKDSYANVYEKGTLINMALDITLRDLSNGEKGVLWLLKELSKKYGDSTPFKDDVLFDEIVKMTYPEVKVFFDTHVIGTKPIDYNVYFDKVGLMLGSKTEQSGYFLKGQDPYIDVDPSNNNSIFIRKGINLNSFLIAIGAEGGDVIKTINGTPITLETIRAIIGQSFSWTGDEEIEMIVDRGGKEVILKGKVGVPTVETEILRSVDSPSQEQLTLRNSWMKE